MNDSDPLRSRSSKRRRVNGIRSPSRYSSPDELAASSDHETPTYHRRTSSNNLRRPSAEHQRRSYEASDPEDSPDELDHTIHTFYRDSWSRNLRPTASRHVTPDAPSEISLLTPIQAPASPATPPPSSPKEARYLPYRQKMVLKGHWKGVSAVRISPKGDMVASCCSFSPFLPFLLLSTPSIKQNMHQILRSDLAAADGTIRIWSISTGKLLRTLLGHLAGISTLAWSPDSRTLASGSDDKSIRLWDTMTGKAYPLPLLGHHNYIYSIAFSPKGNMLVSGSYDEAVFLWDVRTARVMRSLPAHSDPVGGVDFVRDGTLIVSCAGDGLIRIWDTATGQCLRTLVHEDNAPVSSVRFSPNGKFVLAWTLDSCVRLWNYVEGRCVKTYQGHQNTKFSIGGAFGVYGDQDGEVRLGEKKAFAVSGSETGEILWWDVQSKEVLQREKAHEGCVLGVDTWGKESLMVSCGLDKTIRIWERETVPEVDDGDGGDKSEDRLEDKLGAKLDEVMKEGMERKERMDGVGDGESNSLEEPAG
ncbi:MAG: hypothetical protein LQ343_003029 [Gyalolechia ehrenbergii]|nr:MAG: hypothetical protein LQ343_003029 [Gyalolechia ehrenbergii]